MYRTLGNCSLGPYWYVYFLANCSKGQNWYVCIIVIIANCTEGQNWYAGIHIYTAETYLNDKGRIKQLHVYQ